MKKEKNLDQLEIAEKYCLLQPCEIKEDYASGRCYGCKIGSSIANAYFRWNKKGMKYSPK